MGLASVLDKKKAKKDLKVGDVVQLKSGGPVMTINAMTETSNLKKSFECLWFYEDSDPDGHTTWILGRAFFIQETLVHYDSAE